MINVLFVGDTSVGLEAELKGSDVEFFVRHHRVQTNVPDALAKDPEIRVDHIHTVNAFGDFPFSLKELQQYDLIFFSDVDVDSFQLYPDMMGHKPVPLGPNRLKLVQQFVKQGGGFIMGGGYASFNGRRGIGGYHRTPIEKILPVNMLPGDDRVEMPEGFHGNAVLPDHPVINGLRWNDQDFLMLGYNEVKMKEGAELLVEFEGDPTLAVWEYGQGRTMAFTPDPGPHWSGNFHLWESYPKFLSQTVRWLTRKDAQES